MIEVPKDAARRLASAAISQGYKAQALHVYTDTAGNPLHWRIRLKNPITGDKWIRPMKLSGGGYTLGEPEYRAGKPLYRLHDLATRPSDTVIVVEGEWCADALAKAGALATTSGAADTAEKADWSIVAESNVLIWPDNDEAGKRYGEAVRSILLEMKCTVRVIDIAALNLPHKGDAVDWLKMNSGATMADIDALPTVEALQPAHTLSRTLITGEVSEALEAPVGLHKNGKPNPLPRVQITCAADIKPEAIRWLWEGWLARGKFHIFAGMAGTGKTTIAITIIATISIGGRFPDGTRAPIGNVLIWSGEDSAKDTLVPRLLAAGADMTRVHFIGEVQHGGEVRSFDPATDIEAMTAAAARIGEVTLLLVDPVVNAVAGDSHKNGEVRRALQPLVDFGEKLDCAVLGISHFSKGTGGKDPMERVTGSLAFAALARVVLATGKINEGGTIKRIFCRAKSNIGLDSGGFEYDLHQKEIDGHKGVFSSYALWGQAVEGTATELLAENTGEDASEGASVEAFLREELAAGAVAQKDIEQECKDAGFSLSTTKRAKKRLGIVSKKDGMKGVWFWSLPNGKHEEVHEGDEEVQQNSVNPFGKFEPLREDSTETATPYLSHLRV